MFNRSKWVFIGVCLGLVCTQTVRQVSARDNVVYENLLKSRDAMLAQRAYLQKASDGFSNQINDLQDKQKRVNDYLRQIDQALKDIDLAVRQAD